MESVEQDVRAMRVYFTLNGMRCVHAFKAELVRYGRSRTPPKSFMNQCSCIVGSVRSSVFGA